jgi:acetyl esterase/lipase
MVVSLSIGYGGFECHLSQLFNISVLHVEYRLSPEYPLPAPVEDTVAVYHALLHRNMSSSQILMMDDSAGGGLSLLTIQSLITHQLPVPRGVIVLSPWTDPSTSGESHTRNRLTDVMLRSNNNNWMISQLLGPNHTELSANNSLFSPLFGSFEGFPSIESSFCRFLIFLSKCLSS